MRRDLWGYAVAIFGVTCLVSAFLPIRDSITPLSKGFGFLTVVVVAAAIGGLGPGVLASVLGFVAFNFFFIPPYGTFVIDRVENIVILFVFLGLSVLISALLSRAMERATAAEERERELRALLRLSADVAAAIPGPAVYQELLSRLVELFGFSVVTMEVRDPGTHQVVDEVAFEAPDERTLVERGSTLSERSTDRLPLSVGGRVLGSLSVTFDPPELSKSEGRVLRAFSDQVALVLERDRLLRAATEAEALRQAEAVRRSLLAAVSHELTSPLAAIKASVTDLLSADGQHRTDEVREALETVDLETDRLTTLVKNLLDMSRMEGGMLRPRIQAVDLDEIISACADRIRHEHPDLELNTSVDDEGAIVRADPVLLERVLSNLFENAAKAVNRSRSREIEVRSRRADGMTVVRVVDHGGGVAETERDRIFFPFFQVEDEGRRQGMGLGLAICKGFVSLMNGKIWIEDTPGGGATFAVSLPAGRYSA